MGPLQGHSVVQECGPENGGMGVMEAVKNGRAALNDQCWMDTPREVWRRPAEGDPGGKGGVR